VLARGGGGDGIGVIIGPIVVLIALIAAALGFGKPDPNKWYGKMTCSRCNYFWESRRNTAPARCPRCGSGQINQQLG